MFVERIGPLQLDDDGGPLYMQIADAIAAAIAEGKLMAGDRLPPERDLAVELAVSRDTVRQSLGELQRHGRLVRTVGRAGGTFVAEPKVSRHITRYAGLADQLKEQSIEGGARVLSARERAASPAIAAALEISAGERVYEIVRVRLANGKPMALEHTYYSVGRLPGLLDHPLDGSLDDLVRTRYGQDPVRAIEYLEPILAGPEEVAALEVKEGAPLMFVERIAFTGDGAPLEFGRDVFRGDRTRMVVIGLPYH